MYAAETNGDQVKLPVEEGISEEVAQKVKRMILKWVIMKFFSLNSLFSYKRNHQC
jgi:hypothetical protein